MAGVDELFNRAVNAQRDGDLISAERDYRQLLEIEPQHAIALSNLGVILGRRGALGDAVATAEKATECDPNLAVAHFNLGNLYRRIGRSVDAVKSYNRVLKISPDFAPGYLNLGIAFIELGDWQAARERFQKAVELNPDLPDALHHLGESLHQTGHLNEAIAALRESQKQSPRLPRSYVALGRALFAAGHVEEAIHTLEQALLINPQHAVAHNFLGIALDKANRFDEALVHFQESAKVRPDYAAAWSNLGLSLSGQGRTTEAIEAFSKSLDIRPDAQLASCRLVSLLGSSAFTTRDLQVEHEKWSEKYALNASQGAAVAKRDRAGRFRVGYLFGEFLNAIAPTFLEKLLSHYNRGTFHITCYANTDQVGELVDRIRKLSDEWHTLTKLNDSSAADLIRSHHQDILVDLTGHLVGNRMLVFAHRPAPVQLSLFGYPFTTGLSAIDSRVSDEIADAPGASETLGPEKVIRLPDISRFYVPPPSAPIPGPLPFASQNQLTFGCLSDPAKLSDLCLETWAKLLDSLPGSRLVFQASRSLETARYFTNRFAQFGIDQRRLIPVYRLPENDYYEAYQSIDLALDPFPFNGRATTCDALWMGVPVLTVAGTDCRSRQGQSILSNLGLTDFVADTPEKLIALAKVWAEQPDALADLRASLREMMTRSPLTDAAAYVRNLEAAYSAVINKS